MMHRKRTGFSMVEMILFIGIVGMMSGTLTSVYIATQDARIQQISVAEVEQQGSILLSTISKYTRRAEAIIAPAAGHSGATLALQMAQNSEFPSIIHATASGEILLAQKLSVFSLLNARTIATNFTAQNFGGTTVRVSFDIQTTIPTMKQAIYAKHFETTITLFPDDNLDGGGCGTCPTPICINNEYQWYHCQSDVCTLSPATMSC